MSDRNVNFYQVQQEFEDAWRGREIEKGKGYKQYKRWEWFYEQRAYPTGDRFAANAVQLAREAAPAMFQHNSMMPGGWTYIGNTSIPSGGGGAGRVNSVRNLPGSTTTFFACAPGGGVWKTTNSGVNWSVLNTDDLASIGVSDIAIDPLNTNILYIATGDGDAGDTYSLGVLKSTDAGNTWNSTGLSWTVQNQRTTSRIIIHPTTTSTLLVATSNGIWRTVDGGTNWSQVRTGNFKDIKFHPTNPSIVYAAGTSFWRSTDGGVTWTQVTDGVPASGDVSRLALAVSVASPDYVYILAGGTDNGFQGLYRSTNAGVTFSTRYSGPINLMGWNPNGLDSGGQAWYDLCIEADPTNAEIIYTGGVNIWKSSNGGTSWSLNGHWYGGGGAPYVHADIHSLYFVPGTSRLLVGCDGGVFTTTNGGTAYSDISSNLQIAQQYRLGLSTSNSNLIITGWQDNGTNLKNGAVHTRPIGGDGMECLINPTTNNIMYGELYYGEILRSNNGGVSFGTLVCGSDGTGVNEQGAWVTPYMLGSNPSHLYVGKSRVYKSLDAGNTFSSLGAMGSGNINALHVAPANNDYIYASKAGTLYRSTDGNNFTSLSGLPGLYITYITTNPANASEVYVTFSGFNSSNKVFKSLDAGNTWQNITGALPNIPANCIVYQSGTSGGLYVGTDAGVYYRDDVLGNWVPFMNDMPNVVVTELEIHYATNTIVAATYGRGLWSSLLYTLPAYDAVLTEVISPEGTYCSTSVTPQLSILNSGSNTLTSIQVTYSVAPNPSATFTWTGNLATGQSATINLPSLDYGAGSFTFDVSITSINGGVVENDITNNSGSTTYNTTNASNTATLTLLTDCYAYETSWAVFQGATELFTGSGYFNDTEYTIPICLADGCFTLVMYDSYGDGLSSCAGGSYELTDNATGNILAQMGAANFGGQVSHNFCFNQPAPGCTNPIACNYDPAAQSDDGSCILPPANDVCSNAIALVVDGPAVVASNINACNNSANPSCGGAPQIQDVWFSFVYTGGDVEIRTSSGTGAGTPLLTDTRIAVYGSCGGPQIACNDDGTGIGLYSSITLLCANLTIGNTYYVRAGGYQSLTGFFRIQVIQNDINGCTNPLASNFNACANIDNGSCIIQGCTNPAASNYNPAATVDNGSCIISGCTNPAASNYNPAATVDNGSCIIPGCTNPAASNFNPAATVDNGSCIIPGCTNPAASNFNPAATVDNGSCIIPGCTNPTACNYNPTANSNNGSCVFGTVYYQDSDNDGFGNAAATLTSCSVPVGYVLNATDCNDSNPAIRPGAVEICDGVDNDCDTVIDEGCGGSFAVNDDQTNATILTITPLGSCNSISGDLSQASPSAEAQSTCITGEDLWYQFTAVSSGMRAFVSSIQNNILIEVQDADGNMINVENLQSVPGNEVLNYGSLTPGESYYLCVRNFNSAQGSGTFNVCINWIRESTCDVGPGPYQLCSVYKADFTNTWTYIFHFTSLLDGQTISHTRVGSSSLPLSSVTGLKYNTTYSVLIDAVYGLTNGLGQTETVVVEGTEECTMIIGNPLVTQVRTVDGCPNVKSWGSSIQTTPHVCGNQGYQWQITRTDVPSAPYTLTTGTNVRFLSLSSANGFVPGGVYSISVRPIVNSSTTIAFGPARCVQLQGNAAQQSTVETNEQIQMIVYPNPTKLNVFLELNGDVSSTSHVEIRDLMGKLILTEQHNFQSSPTKEINLENITAGIYVIRVIDNGRFKSTMFVKE